ncbi:MAG: Rossmann-like and DUF2520 domain-containing protein [Phototrophicaceae bacterium]
MQLGFIGAGKVGGVLARHWQQAGVSISAVYSHTPAHTESLAQAVGAEAMASPEGVITHCDLTLLTVTDDAIAPLAAQLAATAGDLHGKGIIHTSGAHNAQALEPLAQRGAQVGSLHPAFPFANAHLPYGALDGVAFAVEAESEALEQQLLMLVGALNGHAIRVPSDQKALYHAALCIASNYSVTLYDIAAQLLARLTDQPQTIRAALAPLVKATADNLVAFGTPKALTGPLVRGDAATIHQHLEALYSVDPTLATLYIALANHSRPMLTERGTPLDTINSVLTAWSHHEPQNDS